MNNLFWGDDGDLRGQARQLIKNHQMFLKNATGNTTNSEVDRFLINPQGIIADHMHFTNKTAMQGYPNNYGTTEGQTLLIMANIYTYLATRNPADLAAAEKAFEDMVKYFYSEDVPSTPRRWVANWTLNAKEPILANYPFNPVDPTLGGFKGVLLNYSNGRAIVPAGSPYYGEYLDKATFAYVGQLSWDSIMGDVVKINPDGTVDWKTPGTKYQVDWVIDYLHRKVSYTNAVLEENSTLPVGTIQLQNTSVNGRVKTNFCTRNPVSAGGRMIERNQHWYQYPLWAPSPGPNFDTNASDAELWFADAMDMLYSLTNNERYLRAHQCSMITIKEYMDIDSTDKFFRKSINATTPFTDGISYFWSFPDGYQPRFTRSGTGVNQIPVNGAIDITMEQQAVWFRVNQNSSISIEMGAIANDSSPVSRIVEVELNDVKNIDTGTTYIYQLDDATNGSSAAELIQMTHFARKFDDSGNVYNLANKKAITTYGSTTISSGVQQAVVDLRSAYVLKATLPDTTSGLIIGAWLTASTRFNFDKIWYKSTGQVVVRLKDSNNWIWEQLIEPSTLWSVWDKATHALYLSSYQPDHTPAEPKPTSPSSNFAQAEIIPITSAEFTYYCVDAIPSLYDGHTTYTMKERCEWSTTSTTGATYFLGDYTCIGYLPNSLAFTPGVVPFSNNYRPSDNSTFDGYRGLPYAAYQYPSIYIKSNWDNLSTLVNNVIAFMKSGQQTWKNEGGPLGPSKTAYVWNRWDNLQQGPADTWLTATTGDTVWPGYQPRCHYAAARCWYEMVMEGYPVPQDLIDYVDNWTNFIYNFQQSHNGRYPNTYMNLNPGVTDVIAGDTTGLHIAACAYTYLAGSTNPNVVPAMEGGVKEAMTYFTTIAGGNFMNGSWNNSVANKETWGFWSGEMLRGLSMYIMATDLQPKTDVLINVRKARI